MGNTKTTQWHPPTPPPPITPSSPSSQLNDIKTPSTPDIMGDIGTEIYGDFNLLPKKKKKRKNHTRSSTFGTGTSSLQQFVSDIQMETMNHSAMQILESNTIRKQRSNSADLSDKIKTKPTAPPRRQRQGTSTNRNSAEIKPPPLYA